MQLGSYWFKMECLPTIFQGDSTKNARKILAFLRRNKTIFQNNLQVSIVYLHFSEQLRSEYCVLAFFRTTYEYCLFAFFQNNLHVSIVYWHFLGQLMSIVYLHFSEQLTSEYCVFAFFRTTYK